MIASAPDLNSPKFAPIRADLARLFIVHKPELRLDWPDAEIVARVDDIAAALMVASMDAVVHDDQAWMARHRWFAEAVERLFRDQPAVALDG
jgi:hypothetical protein